MSGVERVNESIKAIKEEILAVESLEDLSSGGRAYVELMALLTEFEAATKGKGPQRHGPSIKCPDIYEALRREGMSKTKAAKISNECYSKKNCSCH